MRTPPKIGPKPASKHEELFEDANQHLWAISYSDLLMVLMTFFILFFHYSNKKTPDSAFNRILFSLQKETGIGAVAGAGAGSGVREPNSIAIEKIENSLREYPVHLEVADGGKELVLQFEADMFGSGLYELAAPQRKKLIGILGVLRPFQKEIQITFIGHTDGAAVRDKKGVVNSNLVLSTLRASRAAEVTVLAGIDPKIISAKGMGEYDRKTRSLTMRISVKQ